MPYLVCYKCDVYYEVTEEEVMEFTHCECGEELIYFENLEDSYSDGEEEHLYEALNEAEGTYLDLDKEINIEDNPQGRETISNGTSFTQEKATQYRKVQEKGQLVSYTGVILFIISLFALIGTLNLFYGLMTLAGVFLGVYGNSIHEKGKVEGYSWQKGDEGEKIVASHLNTLPRDYFVYNDVQLPGKGGNIDHIVIGPTGIFVIETKNYSGTYRIKDKQWLYQKQGKWVDLKRNPGSQVRRNTVDLIKFLNDKAIPTKGTWITSLVALNCPNFRVLETPQNYKVLLPETVPKYILHQKKVSDMNLLGRAALELEPLCVELSLAR